MKDIIIFLALTLFCSIGFSQSGWDNQDSGGNRFLSDVCFVDEMNGWAVGQTNTILSTSNGGSIWTEQEVNPSSNYWSVYFYNQNTGWASGTASNTVKILDHN